MIKERSYYEPYFRICFRLLNSEIGNDRFGKRIYEHER